MNFTRTESDEVSLLKKKTRNLIIANAIVFLFAIVFIILFAVERGNVDEIQAIVVEGKGPNGEDIVLADLSVFVASYPIEEVDTAKYKDYDRSSSEDLTFGPYFMMNNGDLIVDGQDSQLLVLDPNTLDTKFVL